MLSDNEWVLSVAELNEYAKRLLSQDPVLRKVRVTGEISGYKVHFNGHHYFVLKDEKARVQCVMFKQDASLLDFLPTDGMQVVLNGNATIYPGSGTFQIVVKSIFKKGLGDLYMQFEAIKQKLGHEGLFDPGRKREIPRYPRRIGIVTSRSGAAVHDIIRVARRRDPGIGVILAPCMVQGPGASKTIARAIERLNEDGRCDVLLIGRGGGSTEELWAFNEEIVARAISSSRIPTISCVGHEVDFTIADFVADRRAATPSAAAEVAVPVRAETEADLSALKERLTHALAAGQQQRRTMLGSLSQSIVLKHPEIVFLEPTSRKLNDLLQQISSVLSNQMNAHAAKLDRLEAVIDSMDPKNVLRRGFAAVIHNDRYVQAAAELHRGDDIRLLFADGQKSAEITDTE